MTVCICIYNLPRSTDFAIPSKWQGAKFEDYIDYIDYIDMESVVIIESNRTNTRSTSFHHNVMNYIFSGKLEDIILRGKLEGNIFQLTPKNIIHYVMTV